MAPARVATAVSGCTDSAGTGQAQDRISRALSASRAMRRQGEGARAQSSGGAGVCAPSSAKIVLPTGGMGNTTCRKAPHHRGPQTCGQALSTELHNQTSLLQASRIVLASYMSYLPPPRPSLRPQIKTNNFMVYARQRGWPSLRKQVSD